LIAIAGFCCSRDLSQKGRGTIGPVPLPAVARRTLRIDPIAEARRHWVEAGWGDAADGMSVVTSVMRVQQILAARVDRVLQPFGLTFARYEVLMLLLFSQRGSLPLGKIGERLQVHPASVTNAIDRLEADGLVQRTPNPVDGRGVLAVITPAARTLARRATTRLNEDVFGNLGLDPGDERRVFDLLAGIRLAEGDFAPPIG
jgi:DNA-binding MarR family transcriptional regulator